MGWLIHTSEMDSEGPREEKENGCSSEMEQKKVGLMREMVEGEDPTSKVYSFLRHAFFFFPFFYLHKSSLDLPLQWRKIITMTQKQVTLTD